MIHYLTSEFNSVLVNHMHKNAILLLKCFFWDVWIYLMNKHLKMQFLVINRTAEAVAVDVTEQAIERPLEKQKDYYSGKKSSTLLKSCWLYAYWQD